jgi:alpha-L-fucosidase
MDEICHLCVGASYVILTAKHHDGFCPWPTKSPSKESGCTKEDIVGRFVRTARKYGLKAGLYYSWSEFGLSFTKGYMEKIVVPQIKELHSSYDIWWFDGDWECRTAVAGKLIDECCTMIKRDGVEINDRIGHKEERKDPE